MPEHALATATVNGAPPCETTNVPAPAVGSAAASPVGTTIASTPSAVAFVNRASVCSTNTRYGSGHARRRKHSGNQNDGSDRVPNSSTRAAATNSGSVSKSKRLAQKYVDHTA